MKTLRHAIERLAQYAVLGTSMMACIAVVNAEAAEWKPDRPIEIISGVAAGGSLDLAARTIQKILQEKRNGGLLTT